MVKTKQDINKDYYEKKKRQYITCPCGTRVYKYALKQHQRTKRHEKLMSIPNEILNKN